ncbi:hypothetical protein EV13_2520 [Prochlorococcus sp. MIT 0702]|nr:hypothetical protein EV12_2307 [Prochlorococcus sp. MIT 0701]KGG26386.1 hypothetical protein EV13_2520 [Prochlorococcus sp. MIT 0702]KGG31194.1 hypothetical protein EV14_2565 [Prochlorococcus sp. MIT 0703]
MAQQQTAPILNISDTQRRPPEEIALAVLLLASSANAID